MKGNEDDFVWFCMVLLLGGRENLNIKQRLNIWPDY